MAYDQVLAQTHILIINKNFKIKNEEDIKEVGEGNNKRHKPVVYLHKCTIKMIRGSQQRLCISLIPALRILRQVNLYEVKTGLINQHKLQNSQSYTVKTCLKNKTKTNK